MFKSKIKGYFMLFRILPVMVWSLTATLIGTALANYQGFEIKWTPFLLVLTIAALIQGFPTHILNEIYDWKSGADGKELRTQKSGGSKVLQARLLMVLDLWKAFLFSNLALAALIFVCVSSINIKMLYFILPGYVSGLLYSLPPFRFSYRPFLGEWLGGFSGIFFLVLGSYYVQTLQLEANVVFTACGVALTYIGIMIFFHYLDYENDRQAIPTKNTTVVYLGLKGSRRYAIFCLLASILIFSVIIFKSGNHLILLLLLSSIILLSHNRIDLSNPFSIIKWGKVITFSTLIAGLSFAALSSPSLGVMTIPALFGFWGYKKFGKLKNLKPQSSN